MADDSSEHQAGSSCHSWDGGEGYGEELFAPRVDDMHMSSPSTLAHSKPNSPSLTGPSHPGRHACCQASQAGLTPHALRVAPSIQVPGGTLFLATYCVPSGAEPGLIFNPSPCPSLSSSQVPPGKDIPSTDNSGVLIRALSDCATALSSWGDKPWAVEADKACLAHSLTALVNEFVSKGWHHLPFLTHLPAGCDLELVMANLIPWPPLDPQTHRSAESADTCAPPPSYVSPSESTACPSAPCPPPSSLAS